MLRPWQMKFWLDDSPGQTFHAKLMNKLIADIKDGRLAPNSMLPGSRTLAKQLGVNRKTVQLVYEELESQGWLVTKPRCGSFISNILPEKKLSNKNKKLINNSHKTKPPSELVENIYQDALSTSTTTLQQMTAFLILD